MKWTYDDATLVQRHEEGEKLSIARFQVIVPPNERPCGTVAVVGSVTEQGTRIEFRFKPAMNPPSGCCEQYGWIQHVLEAEWRYDNAGAGGRRGAPSDPDAVPQGNPTGNRWDPNPWYGGPGDVVEKHRREIKKTHDGAEQSEALEQFEQEWPGSPDPQTTIRDIPGGELGFVTQLVCIESGKVVFQYRWLQYRLRGEVKWKFVGSPGTNMRIAPE